MKIDIGSSNIKYDNNFVSKVNYSFISIPYVTINKYFVQSIENSYFLILSLLQLSTSSYINLLPKEWSPTGPYSTFIPLLLCFLLDLFTILIGWIYDKLYEISENYKYIKVYKNGRWKNEYSKNIYPGDIIYINEGSIIPVDSIALYSETNNPKICLSSLNGEADLVPIKLITNDNFEKYISKKIIINNLYLDNLSRFDSNIDSTNIDEKYFLPGGGTNLDNSFIAVSISCGKNKKCYNQAKCSKFEKINNFDKLNGNYMMNVNAKLLILKVIILTFISCFYSTTQLSILYFVEKIIQNWILFNGIIPFSIKLLSLLSRYIQSKQCSLDIKNSNIIDQFEYINTIISDKTGTLTKNIMDFSKLVVPNGTILNLNNNTDIPINILNNNLELIKCLGLCIHINNGKFSTPEDEIIRKRYYYLGCNIFQENDDITIILSNGIKFIYKLYYIDKLEFSSHRKRSSVIVKDENDGYYIYSKGSVDTIKSLIKNDDVKYLELCDKCIIENYAELRVLACGFKKLDNFTIQAEYSIDYLESLEKNINYVGLVGLRDHLQDNIKHTVKFLEINKKFISVCTGDRKETAIAISKECGIIEEGDDIDISVLENFVEVNNIQNKTILFDGAFLSKNVLNNYENLMGFYNILKNSKNFVGYSLLPKHKKNLVDLFESNNNNVLSVGDGSNDIPMLKSSTIGISIDHKINRDVIEISDIKINKFSDLKEFYNYSLSAINRNIDCAEFTLFKTIYVSFALMMNIILNGMNFNSPIIQGLELQGFHILWCTLPIIYLTCFSNNLYILRKDKINNVKYEYFKWILGGICCAINSIIISDYFDFSRESKLFSMVLTLNSCSLIKINNSNYKIIYFLIHLVGISLFLLYLWFIEITLPFSLVYIKQILSIILSNLVFFIFI